jgi:16S rRNA (uracil1498-N3)-methyltransferase
LIDVLPDRGSEVAVPDDQAHHVRSVRRARNGDTVECIDRNGATARGRIVEITDATLRVRIDDAAREGRARGGVIPSLTVMPALVPEAKLDLVLQKCTEIGVAECRPVISARCLVRTVRGGFGRKLPRWQKICDEAARQCGGAPMRVYAPCSYDEAVRARATLRVVADRDGAPLDELAESLAHGVAEAAVLVGPEGGFTEDELQAALDSGWRRTAFNHNTMRAETAALVCCALLQHALVRAALSQNE